MAVESESPRRRRARRPPAKTVESREAQVIAKAIDLAEEQIERGVASAQVITHYLKLGTTREKLEQERLKNENELLKAKVDNLANQANMEEMYKKALQAMSIYQGRPVDDEDPDVQ